jgi:hypothetical protein
VYRERRRLTPRRRDNIEIDVKRLSFENSVPKLGGVSLFVHHDLEERRGGARMRTISLFSSVQRMFVSVWSSVEKVFE